MRHFLLGDSKHPDEAAYNVVNLAEALKGVDDTGDWYRATRNLLDRLLTAVNTRGLKPNVEQRQRITELEPAQQRHVEQQATDPYESEKVRTEAAEEQQAKLREALEALIDCRDRLSSSSRRARAWALARAALADD